MRHSEMMDALVAAGRNVLQGVTLPSTITDPADLPGDNTFSALFPDDDPTARMMFYNQRLWLKNHRSPGDARIIEQGDEVYCFRCKSPMPCAGREDPDTSCLREGPDDDRTAPEILQEAEDH